MQSCRRRDWRQSPTGMTPYDRHDAYACMIYKQEMSNRCRRSILCLARRGRRCLEGAVVVVIALHFRCFRIDLSSTEALIEGRLHQLLETHSESSLSSLLQTGREPNPQVLRCLILLDTESALRRLLSSVKRAPAAEGCVTARPEEGEIYTLLSRQLTPSSSSPSPSISSSCSTALSPAP